MVSPNLKADIFGGDVAVLIQILTNSVQQLVQLKQILGSSHDTLGMMKDINRGLRDGLKIVQLFDPKFAPGLYGDLNSSERAYDLIQSIYGRIPQTSESKLQYSHDQSVAESLSMTGNLYRVADSADEESKKIFMHSQDVNPQGAAKLTAQSIAVLINVSTQLLRTNSMMLKLMSQNLALQNRHEKIQSEHFKAQYDGLATAIGDLPRDTNIQALSTGGF